MKGYIQSRKSGRKDLCDSIIEVTVRWKAGRMLEGSPGSGGTGMRPSFLAGEVDRKHKTCRRLQ